MDNSSAERRLRVGGLGGVAAVPSGDVRSQTLVCRSNKRDVNAQLLHGELLVNPS